MPVLSTDKPTWVRSAFYFLPLTLVQFSIVLMSILFMMGVVFFCRIPYLARGVGVNASDVAVRCLDWHQAEPFYLIEGYDEAIADIAIAWPPMSIHKVETETLKNRGGYRHTLTSPTGDVHHTLSTTPHTLLKQAEIDEARAGLARIYPPGNRLAWAQALSWGEGLMLRWWQTSYKKKHRSGDAPIVEPRGGTEDEQIWFAWQRLRAGMPQGGADLTRLETLVRGAYPDAADYDAALAWARAFHERRERYFREWRTMKRGQHSATTFYGETALPPLVDASLWWILYQHVGLNDDSRAAARSRWLRFFPGKETETLAWGRTLEKQRRDAGEPLPPTSDNVALVCVIEKLTGWDGYGVKTRQIALQALDPFPGNSFGSVDTFVDLAISMGYPNDDIFLLLASGDPLKIGVLEDWDMDRSTPLYYFGWLAGWFLLLGIFLFLLRSMVLDTLGGTLLLMREHDRFRNYYNGQVRTNIKAFALGFVLVPLLKWGWEWWKLKPPAELLMVSPFRLLAGVYMGVLFGGVIILIINRLVAVVMIRLGYNIEKTWIDEIIGTTLGVALLAYFGNDWASLLAFAAAGVLPDVFKRLWKRKHPPPTVHAPVTLTLAAAEALRQWRRREPARRYVRIYEDGSQRDIYCLNLDDRFDPAIDVLLETHGLSLVILGHQVEYLRGLVVDHGGQPPRFQIHAPGTTNIPLDEDEAVVDPEPLILEPYPTARWTGLTIGLAFAAFTVFALACEPRAQSVPVVTNAPVTIHLTYPANAGWLSTGITLDPDQIVTVRATGEVNAGPAHGKVTPAGLAPNARYPEPKLPGLSLLGRVGIHTFPLGAEQAFQVNDKAVTLLLGMNDDDLADNAGHWNIEITVRRE